MTKHLPFPAICERCERKITDKTGWGVLVICSVQAQPNVDDSEGREMGVRMCGYCFHELAHWLCPEIDDHEAVQDMTEVQ
jgi:hypothetical protein